MYGVICTELGKFPSFDETIDIDGQCRSTVDMNHERYTDANGC